MPKIRNLKIGICQNKSENGNLKIGICQKKYENRNLKFDKINLKNEPLKEINYELCSYFFELYFRKFKTKKQL